MSWIIPCYCHTPAYLKNLWKNRVSRQGHTWKVRKSVRVLLTLSESITDKCMENIWTPSRTGYYRWWSMIWRHVYLSLQWINVIEWGVIETIDWKKHGPREAIFNPFCHETLTSPRGECLKGVGLAIRRRGGEIKCMTITIQGKE